MVHTYKKQNSSNFSPCFVADTQPSLSSENLGYVLDATIVQRIEVHAPHDQWPILGSVG